MSLRDFFSRRTARAEKAGQLDVYQYTELPPPFRVQVVHIWERALGNYSPPGALYGEPEPAWTRIESDLAEAHGLFHLGDQKHWRNADSAKRRVTEYFLHVESINLAIDVIEAVFSVIDGEVRKNLHYARNFVTQPPNEAINDLNERFREHGIGYQYSHGQIIRVDSQFIHAEAVKPTLTLLSDPKFKGPQDEFLRAHKHYRDGKYKESINEALKSFESTMKTICDLQRWTYDKNKDTASKLVDVLFREQLIPPHMQTTFSGMRSLLESAVPTTRNRMTGHGQGAVPTEVPECIAAYALHVTASNIVLLVGLHNHKI